MLAGMDRAGCQIGKQLIGLSQEDRKERSSMGRSGRHLPWQRSQPSSPQLFFLGLMLLPDTSYLTQIIGTFLSAIAVLYPTFRRYCTMRCAYIVCQCPPLLVGLKHHGLKKFNLFLPIFLGKNKHKPKPQAMGSGSADSPKIGAEASVLHSTQTL